MIHVEGNEFELFTTTRKMKEVKLKERLQKDIKCQLFLKFKDSILRKITIEIIMFSIK